MREYFKEMFHYTYYFNNEVIITLSNIEIIPEKSLRLINHTLNAQEIWNNRVENRKSAINVWEMRDLSDLKDINTINYKRSIEILDLYNLEDKITYKNSRREVYTNKIKDILFHIVNHSTYHRGQIATDFKANGLDPLVTDYIFYKR